MRKKLVSYNVHLRVERHISIRLRVERHNSIHLRVERHISIHLRVERHISIRLRTFALLVVASLLTLLVVSLCVCHPSARSFAFAANSGNFVGNVH